MAGRPCGHFAEQLHATRLEVEQSRQRRCRRPRRTAPPACSSGRTFRARAAASATPPTASEVELVSPRCGDEVRCCSPRNRHARPWMPKSLGNCVLARNSATPHLNPIMTLSEMKLTIDAGAHQPGDKRDERHEQGRACRQCAEPRRVAAGDLAERRADQQRDGGGDGDGRVPRTAKQPEDQPGEQAGVKAGLGRQVGERGIAQARRQHIGRKRDGRRPHRPAARSGRRSGATSARATTGPERREFPRRAA